MAALVKKFSELFFKVRGQEMLGGVERGRDGAFKSNSIHMEGSYEKDQKTIGGLDFFDELTNLQIFCRSKQKVCFSDAVSSPTPASENQASTMFVHRTAERGR